MFITYRSTEVVSARERRDLIQKLGRRKVLALDLVVPFVQKRDAGDNLTRKKASITTAGNLLSKGKVPNTCSVYLVCVAPRYMAQLVLQMERARTTHMDVGGPTFAVSNLQ